MIWAAVMPERRAAKESALGEVKQKLERTGEEHTAQLLELNVTVSAALEDFDAAAFKDKFKPFDPTMQGSE